jgi:hypothetical protein
MTLAEALRKGVGAIGGVINTVGQATGASALAKAVAPNFTLASTLQNYGGNVAGSIKDAIVPRQAYAAEADMTGNTSQNSGGVIYDQNGNPIGSSSRNASNVVGGGDNGGGGGDNGGGDGGGSSGGSTEDLINALITKGGYNPTDARNAANGPDAANLMNEFFNTTRSNTSDNARKALEAALGVFNTKAQNLRDQIPGIEASRDLRVRGLNEGLTQFNDTASREEASRLATIQANEKTTQDTYSTAERTTRASAKSLANKLRNMFAGAGTLDSSQYKDMNVDQSKEILQSLGDIRREGAGKLAISKQEQDDLTKYYGEQKNQFDQKTKLAIDTAKADADKEITGVLGDINLTDSQKIEAVQQAQGKLDERLASIDEAQIKFKSQQESDAQDLAIKLAELKQKGVSSTYTDSQKVQKSLTAAVDVVNKIATNMPGANKAEIAAQVFASYPELKDVDPASLFGKSYTGGDNPDQQLSTLYGAQ